MKRTTLTHSGPARLLAAAFSLALCAMPVRVDAQETAAIRQEIQARIDELLAAFRRGDAAGIARLFADDATILGPQGLRVHGRMAIDSYWVARPRPDSWEIETDEVGGSADAPWQYARSIRVVSVDGRPERRVTTFVIIWKRDQSGRLRIYLDLFT